MCEVMSMPFIVPAEMINNLDQWPKEDVYKRQDADSAVITAGS